MKKRITVALIISTAVALLAGVTAISFAAWRDDNKTATASGYIGSISYAYGLTVETDDGIKSGENTYSMNPLYPIDFLGDGQRWWKFSLSADTTGDSDAVFSIIGNMKIGETVLPASSAQLYWSASAPNEQNAERNAFGNVSAIVRPTSKGKQAEIYVFFEAFSVEAMNATVHLEFTVCDARDVTFKAKLHKMGATLDYSGAATFTDVANPSNTYTVNFVNGSATVPQIITPATYSVSIDDQTYDACQTTVEQVASELTLTFEYKRFDYWVGFDKPEHDFSKVNDAQPVLGNDGKTLNVITNDKYGDAAASLWVKKGNSSKDANIQGLFVKYGEGQHMFLRTAKANELDDSYQIRWIDNFGESSGYWWGHNVQSVVHESRTIQQPLTKEQRAAYESADGLKVTIVRKGYVLYTFVNNVWLAGGTMTLPNEYAESQIQVGYWAYDSKANATWKFDIESDIAPYLTKVKKFDVSSDRILVQNGSGTLDKTQYLYGERATLTLTPAATYTYRYVTVCGKAVDDAVTSDNKYTFEVKRFITASAAFATSDIIDNVAFHTPAAANANGLTVTLTRDGETPIVGTVADNKFTATNVKTGRWKATAVVYGVTVNMIDVIVGSSDVALDLTEVFGTEDATDFGNVKEYDETKHQQYGKELRYTVPTNLSGDAYFRIKLWSDTDTSKIANDMGRFGLRMFYKVDGKDAELGVTVVIKNGKWRLQTCGDIFREVDLSKDSSAHYLDSIKNDGLYLALYRQASTGFIYVYLGTKTDDAWTFKQVTRFYMKEVTDISKNPVSRFGAAFWNDGCEYNARLSDIMYAETESELGLNLPDPDDSQTSTGATQTASTLECIAIDAEREARRKLRNI